MLYSDNCDVRVQPHVALYIQIRGMRVPTQVYFIRIEVSDIRTVSGAIYAVFICSTLFELGERIRGL